MKIRSRVLGAIVGASILALAAVAPATAATAAAPDTAKLSVLHAVPKTPVNVFVNGKLTLKDFRPGSLAGPLALPAGTYSVAITAATAKDASKPIIGPIDLPLKAGGYYTAVAHLKAHGTPTATLFTNDVSKTAAGQGRLTVRHVAGAPAVDVLAGGKAVIKGLTNPNEKVLELPAGTISAAVAAAGTTKPLIGPASVNVAEGANTIVYAWGSAKQGDLAFAVQTYRGLNSGPNGINTGNAGLAAENPGFPAGWTVAAVVALMLLIAGAGTTALVRARR